MDVTKIPAPGTAGAGAPASAPQADAQAPARSAALADHADIRPLDVPAALQILLAEVRASFESMAIAIEGDAAAAADNPNQAARALLQLALQALPDGSASPPAASEAPPSPLQWNAELLRMEAALQAGLERAIVAVAGWRDVPAGVVDAAKGTRALVLTILGDDPQNPIWLRPEWAGLAPRFERFWRRRRRARRHLSDPDHFTGSFDDGSESRT